MKKLFYVLALAAFVTACNSSSETEKSKTDTIKPADTTITMPDTTVVDTTRRDTLAK